MNEEKKVPFKWEYGEETISLQLGMYANNQRLYICMITHTEDGAEPFADMTVNLPGYSLDTGEAFISGDISKDLLRYGFFPIFPLEGYFLFLIHIGYLLSYLFFVVIKQISISDLCMAENFDLPLCLTVQRFFIAYL